MVKLACAYMPFNIVEAKRYRWADRLQRGVLDADTVAIKMRALAERLRKIRISKLAKQDVCIALDKGTVYNGYMAIIIIGARGEMTVWKLTPTADSRFKDGCTGEVIGDEIIEVYDELKAVDVRAVAVVTDNAANMLKGVSKAVKERAVVGVPCFAHAGQLFVKDVNECEHTESWRKLMERVKEIRSDAARQKPPLRLPEANETRWNSSFRLVKAVVSAQRLEKLDEYNVLDDEEIEVAHEMIAALEPVKHFTNIVQADSATLLEAICAFDLLLEVKVPRQGRAKTFLEDIMDDRIRTFLCDAVFIICVVSPLFNISTMGVPMTRDYNVEIVNQKREDVKGLLSRIVGQPNIKLLVPRDLRAKLLTEANNITTLLPEVWPADPDAAGVSAYEYSAFMQSDTVMSKMPALATLATVLMKVRPTEASCERVFSLVKKVANPQRSRLSPANVMACLQVNYLMRSDQTLKTGDLFDGAGFVVPDGDDDEGGGDVEAVRQAAQNLMLTERAVLRFINAAVDEYEEEAEKLGNKKCECGTALRGRASLQCISCFQAWHHPDCVKNFNKLRAVPDATDGGWTCTACMKKAMTKDAAK
jgi:hypothetical protein